MNNTALRFVMTIGLLGLLALAVWLPSRTQAAPLPPRPTAATRTPTPTAPPPTAAPPTAPPPTAQPAQPRRVVGATIVLHAPSAPAGAWTIVQWQDGFGAWHDVQGWQGTLDDGVQIWWVAERDLHTGPFRWTLYQSQDGALLDVSESFYLPSNTGQVVLVEMEP